MEKKIKAIETIYRNITFRSRTEARWAFFFDEMRIAWKYEPKLFDLGGTRYLPDFFFPSDDLWIEIKHYGDRNLNKPRRFAANGGRIIVLLGDPSRCEIFIQRSILVPGDNRLFLFPQASLSECECGNLAIGFGSNDPVILTANKSRRHGPECSFDPDVSSVGFVVCQSLSRKLKFTAAK